MHAASTSEFIFIAIRAGLPASCASIVASISPMIRSRRFSGATSTRR